MFGIPTQSPYNFLHDYTSMRVGAVLENGRESLEIHRRKGNKDTLLKPDDSPFHGGERELATYLAGADRPFFKRMFGLDHIGLEKGGREILEDKDDVGRILFSAGAGISGLRDCFDALSEEAEGLWSKRRAKDRKFYIAEDKLKEAQRVVREETLTVRKWKECKRAYDKAEEEYQLVSGQIEKLKTERNRLSRIRRVIRDVRRKEELERQIAELGGVIVLPEDAAQVVNEADRNKEIVAGRIADLEGEIRDKKGGLKSIKVDEALIRRDKDVQELHENRIEIRREKAALPKREAELTSAEKRLQDYAKELGWTESDSEVLTERIPSRNRVVIVRGLLAKKGKVEAEAKNYAGLWEESKNNYDYWKENLGGSDEPADVSNLVRAVETLSEHKNLPSLIKSEEKRLEVMLRRVKRRLEALTPSVSDVEALTTMPIPVKDQVSDYRDRARDLKRRQRETKDNIALIKRKREVAVAELERTVQDEQVVTPETIGDARNRRDVLWGLVKSKHVDGKPIQKNKAKGFEKELKNLPGAFESATDEADLLADRRFDNAEAAGRIAEIKRKIGRQETLLKEEQKNESMLIKDGEQLKSEWASMWDAASVEPSSPDVMLKWLDDHEEVLNEIMERKEVEANLESLREKESEAKQRLIDELAALEVDVTEFEEEDLNVVMENAKGELEDQNSFREAANDMARRERDRKTADDDLKEWRGKWASALGKVGLSKDADPDAVDSQMEAIDRMRKVAETIRSIRHDRIEKINQDVANFEEEVKKLVKELAGDLSGQSAEDAVRKIEDRLQDAKNSKDLRDKGKEEIQILAKKIKKLKDEQRELDDSVFHLKKKAGVQTANALADAIGRSEQYQSLKREFQEVVEKLDQEGDGKSLEELEGECKGVEMDQVSAQEESVQEKIDDLYKQLTTTITEERSSAREMLRAISGDDDLVASAKAKEEEAFTEMRNVAERYVQVKTSAILLQWVIERYRQEKQGPLLKRAGELFKGITGGSFANLKIAFNDKDETSLEGVRTDGKTVPLSGMSTGTVDQLYLALRIATIEEVYLKQADGLPFVADDLFINFDDDRATAGFQLLEKLSQKTQVLFFTHHQHLVEIARNTLGDSVNLVCLAD